MALIQPRYSYEQLAQLPDDGQRYEIVEGELVVSPAPAPRHQRVVWNLTAFLRRAEDAGYGKGFVAPLDVVFDPRNVTQPDLLFIRRERLAIVTETNVQGAPDLVVEVLSPSTRERDLGAKRRHYARFGVPYYWAIDPETQTISPYTLRTGGYAGSAAGGYAAEPVLGPGDTLTCALFPGLSVAVADLFG